MVSANACCLVLLLEWVRMAWSLARASAGNSKLAKMAIIAITTSSSIKVKPASGRLPALPIPAGPFLRVLMDGAS